VEDKEEGVDLVVLEGEDLQNGVGIGAVELPEVMDLSLVFQAFGEGVGSALGPQGTGAEDAVGSDAPQGQVGADGGQIFEAAGGEVSFEVAGPLFVPVGFGVPDQVESLDGRSFRGN
jgi:hypothetical protein